jgi:diguanylate cyclase (GGDEF)-like protein
MRARAEALKALIIRHRFTLTDLVMIGAVLAAALFAVWQCDVFPNETAATKQLIFELDEIFAVCALGFALFAWSRLRAQRREILRRRTAEAQARALAFEDPLTGLPNRRQFEEAVRAALAAPPGADAVHAVMMLDLNGFKRINDIHGHPVGDETLIQAALRLRSGVREGDLVARLGGDEFAVLARHLSGPDAAAGLAARVVDALKAPVYAGGGQHHIGSGIGIALAPVDGSDLDTLVRKADVALYRAKAKGASAFRFFEADMDHAIREHERLEHDLRSAIGTPALKVAYRPRVHLSDGRVIGFDAIPEWHHHALGLVDASRLFAIADSAHLTRELVDDLLARACRDAVAWPASVTLSFPLAPQVLPDETFPLRLVAILSESGLPPSRLEFALAESALVAGREAARKNLGVLREVGVRLAVTQFGTGYSSLYHLRTIALDAIRIDRSFVEAMGDDPRSAAVVRALVGLGTGLGLTVTADGVQSVQQQMMLREQGCQHGHGTLFSGLVSADEAARLFASDPSRTSGAMAAR